MGFIKILRWRIGGALNRLAGKAHSFEIGPSQKAAIFALALGRDHAGLLFRQFTSEETRALTTEMNLFHDLEEEILEYVLKEFLVGLSPERLPTYVARDDPYEVARAHVRASAGAVAERLRELWLCRGEQELYVDDDEGDDDDGDLELEYQDLEPIQKVDVFLMWLSPALSASVMAELSSSVVGKITGSIVDLPFVTPKARELVLAEFMQGVSMGIPGLAIDDLGLPIVVEAFVRSDPKGVAKRLMEKWMSGSPVVVTLAPTSQPRSNLTNWEKAAVFFQSLSLPLAHLLLCHLEAEEVESLMKTIDELGGVDSETRKQVLQELMLASKPNLRKETQPIQILGQAMGAMIRRKPQVVAAQIRKAWFHSG